MSSELTLSMGFSYSPSSSKPDIYTISLVFVLDTIGLNASMSSVSSTCESMTIISGSVSCSFYLSLEELSGFSSFDPSEGRISLPYEGKPALEEELKSVPLISN